MPLLYAFIDESERNNSAYFLGALVCTQSEYIYIVEGFNEMMFELSQSWPQIRSQEEFHGSSIMRATDSPWRYIPLRVRFQIYAKALTLIAESGASSFIEGINIYKLENRNYPQKFPPREIAFNYLLERIDACGRDRNQLVRISADKHHTSSISASNFSKYQSFGTFGYKPSRLTNLINPILFIDSHSDRALQASDLVTYIFNRVHTIKESDPRAVSEKLKLWKQIEPALNPPRGRNRIWP